MGGGGGGGGGRLVLGGYCPGDMVGLSHLKWAA